MSESEISVTDGSTPSPAPQDASGGLEVIKARVSTPRIDQEGRGDLDRYATKHDIRHLEDVIARVESGVGSDLRRLETSLNSTSSVLDGRISSLEKIVDVKFTALDGKIDGLEKRMDEKFVGLEKNFDVKFTALDGKIAGLQKSLDDNMAGLKDLLKSELKGVHRVVYFSIAISAVVVGVVLSVAFRM